MTAGTRGRPWFNSLGHGLQLLRVEDQPEGAMALGTPHLGLEETVEQLLQWEASREASDLFRFTKAYLALMITLARKGKLPPYRNRVGSRFCKNQ